MSSFSAAIVYIQTDHQIINHPPNREGYCSLQRMI